MAFCDLKGSIGNFVFRLFSVLLSVIDISISLFKGKSSVFFLLISDSLGFGFSSGDFFCCLSGIKGSKFGINTSEESLELSNSGNVGSEESCIF